MKTRVRSRASNHPSPLFPLLPAVFEEPERNERSERGSSRALAETPRAQQRDIKASDTAAENSTRFLLLELAPGSR